MSDVKFDGRVAIVTGAGAGLGKTYAVELGKRGAKVVVNDLGGARDGTGGSHKAADLVVDEIKSAGGEAAPNYDSVATMEGGKNIVKAAVDNFGKVDIVINNAGILRDKSMMKMTEEEWDAVQSVHLKGTFSVTHAAWPILRENNYGRVVFTSSGAGVYGNFGQANYGAAKMGMVGLMNVLKLEGAKYNILINTIAPTAASRLTEDVMPPEFFERLKPEFVTPLVVYLSSEEMKESGMIFNCALGWYSRAVVMCTDGVIIGDGKRDIAVEEIKENWNKITALENPKPLASVTDGFGYLTSLLS
jgi:NAD(P)-dependent dehydrogenase (short-subunit alcohol dehydrogenase family)